MEYGYGEVGAQSTKKGNNETHLSLKFLCLPSIYSHPIYPTHPQGHFLSEQTFYPEFICKKREGRTKFGQLWQLLEWVSFRHDQTELIIWLVNLNGLTEMFRKTHVLPFSAQAPTPAPVGRRLTLITLETPSKFQTISQLCIKRLLRPTLDC